ncbi:MAG: hypothetical protein ACQEUM_07110 [Pseudomonadota bacterium]
MPTKTLIRNIQSGHVQTAIFEIKGGPYRYHVESHSHIRNIRPGLFTNSWSEAKSAVSDQVAELNG